MDNRKPEPPKRGKEEGVEEHLYFWNIENFHRDFV
jgi:hypothetical protein